MKYVLLVMMIDDDRSVYQWCRQDRREEEEFPRRPSQTSQQPHSPPPPATSPPWEIAIKRAAQFNFSTSLFFRRQSHVWWLNRAWNSSAMTRRATSLLCSPLLGAWTWVGSWGGTCRWRWAEVGCTTPSRSPTDPTSSSSEKWTAYITHIIGGKLWNRVEGPNLADPKIERKH